MNDAPENQPTEVRPGDHETGSPHWAANIPSPASAPESIAPPTPIHPPAAQSAPSSPRIEEVEAVPITRAQSRGPAIEVPGTRHTPEPAATVPPSAPSFASQSSVPPNTPAPPPFTSPPFTATPPPQPPPFPPPPSSPPPVSPPNATTATPAQPGRFWVVLCHLAYLIPAHIPGLALTLIIWAWRRKRDPLLDDQAREALNFQLTYAGATLILTATCLFCLLVPVVWLIGAVLCVVGAVRAADGQRYRYPFIVRLIT